MYDYPPTSPLSPPPTAVVVENMERVSSLPLPSPPSSSFSFSAPPSLFLQLPIILPASNCTTIKTFSWSEYPMIIEEEETATATAAAPATASLLPMTRRRRPRSTFYDGDNNNTAAAFEAVLGKNNNTSMTTSSDNNTSFSAVVEFDSEEELMVSNQTQQNRQQLPGKRKQRSSSSVLSSSSSSSRQQQFPPRGVTFAPYDDIRTYTIVLGEHPWCEDGLAIALGNDYSVSLRPATHPQQQPRSVLHRRDYVERKELLLTLGGYTEQELRATMLHVKHAQQEQLFQQYACSYYDDECENEYAYNTSSSSSNNTNNNRTTQLTVGLTRVQSIDSCLSRVLNTIANAAA